MARIFGLISVLFFISHFSYSNCRDIVSTFNTSADTVCGSGPHRIVLTNTSTGTNNSTAGYFWYRNGAQIANTVGTSSGVTDSIFSNGVYTYMIVGFDSLGVCADTFYKSVIAVQQPVADFTFPIGQLCPNSVIQFTNSSGNTNLNTSYSWSFGDGSVSKVQNPSHLYGSSGNYNVRLTVGNSSSCTSQITKAVTIAPTPSISISGDDGTGSTSNCLTVGDTTSRYTITFTNNSASGVNYTWDFDDGSPLINQNYSGTSGTLVHTFTSYGTFMVVCSAVAPNGCLYTDTVQVDFSKSTSSSFTIPSSEIQGCAPHSVTPINGSVNATIYIWNFGDGSPPVVTFSPAAPTHVYTTSGSFLVTLAASNSCNTSITVTGPITVSTGPNIDYTSTLIGKGCAPQTVGFVNNSSDVFPTNNFRWDMGNGNLYNGSNPPFQTYPVGNYKVKLWAGNGCGVDSVTQNIVVDSFPTGGIALNQNEGCSPLIVNGNGFSTTQGALISWTVDTNVVGYGNSLPVQNFTNDTSVLITHDIIYTSSNHCGSYDTTVTIKIHPDVKAKLDSTNTSFCTGTTISHTSVSEGDSLTYLWRFGNGTSSTGIGPKTIVYNKRGVDSVELIVSGYCGVDSVKKYIFVDSLPYSATTVTSLKSCSPNSIIGSAVPTDISSVSNWYRNNSSSVYSTGNTLTPFTINATGNTTRVETLRYTNTNSCGVFDTTYTITTHPPVEARLNNTSTSVCTGASLTHQSNSYGDSLSYFWDFGNGTTSVLPGPHTITYNTNGQDTLVLIVTGFCGSDTITKIISVDPSSSSQVTLSADSGCSPLIVTGSAINTGSGVTSRWYQNGGFFPFGFNTNMPIRTFTNNSNSVNTESIRFTSSNSCGNYDTTINITVLPSVVARLNNTATNICNGTSLTHQSNSYGDSLSYFWDFGNGTTSTLPGPHTINYATQTVDTLTLIVTGTCGADTIQKIITVSSTTSANVSWSTTEGCSPLIVSGLATSPVQNVTMRWYENGWIFPFATDSVMPPRNYVNNGNTTITNNIRLNASSTCGSFDTTIAITIHPSVSSVISVNDNQICSGETVSFSNQSRGDSLRYLWIFSNGDTSNVFGPHSRTLRNYGKDTTWLITTGYCGSDTSFSVVDVNRAPVAQITQSKDSGCEDLTVLFDNNAPSGSNYSWTFTNGNPSVSNSKNNSVVFQTPGNHSVFLSVDSLGCTSRDTTQVLVFQGPVANFSLTPLEGCSGLEVFITNTSVNSSSNSYNWVFGNGNADSVFSPSSQVFTNPNPATDSVQEIKLIIQTANGCLDSNSKTVTVNPVPFSSFSLADTAQCESTLNTFINNSLGGNSYTWYFGDGDSSASVSPTHSYSAAGVYTIQLIVFNSKNCSDTSSQTITVHPNPVAQFVFDSVCFGQATSFIDSSLFGPVNWKWSFGDGDSSSLQNPLHVYSNHGQFNTRLLVHNQFGCSDSLTKTVAVFETPNAHFSYSTSCAKSPIFFTDSSSGNPVKWFWDFDDGNTDTSQNPSHTFAVGGIYNVSLIAQNASGCSDTLVAPVSVQTIPQTSFAANNVCLGYATSFTNTSVTNLPVASYFWDFGNGNFSNLANPNFQYLASGSYFVSLTVTNIYGCDSTYTDSVFVYDAPSLSFFSFDTVCANNATTFQTQFSSDILIVDYGDGSIIDSFPSGTTSFLHTYSSGGVYSLSVKLISLSGCTDSAIIPVVVTTSPSTHISLIASSFCIGDSIQFLNNSLNANSYLWNFGDLLGWQPNSSVGINPVYAYQNSGIYSVELIAFSGSSCSDTTLVPLSINILPNTIPDFMADTVCFGNATTFTNLDTNLVPLGTYTWDFGDGNFSTGINKTYTYSAAGNYNVTLTFTNISGCTSSFTKVVVVSSGSVANFTHDTVCVGLSTSFSDVSLGNPNSWIWNYGDFSPLDSASGPNAQHAYLSGGRYFVTLTVFDSISGCSSQATHFVEVLNGAQAIFNVSSPVCEGTVSNFLNLSSSAGGSITTVNWQFGDGDSSSLVNPTHTYTNTGVYTVKLSVASNNGCIDEDSSSIIVNSKPVANFGNNSAVCQGNPVLFTDSSSLSFGRIENWYWNFGNGTLDSNQNPTTVFTSAGTFPVSLQVVSDSGCSDMITKTILISAKPLVDINFSPACVGDTVYFTENCSIAIPDSIVNWFWEFGDGNTSTLKNPSHVYLSNNGSYQVKLTVTSSLGCASDSSFTVSLLPVPNFNYGPEKFAYCEKEAVQFYDSSTIALPSTIVGWEWYFRDGFNSFSQNPIHTYDSAGNYRIKVRITSSDGCVYYDSLPAPLIIYPNPVANFTPVPSVLSVFRPETYLENSSTGATNWTWDFGDSTNGFGFNPTHLFPNVVGVYPITQFAYSDFGCVDSITKNIVVKDEYTLYVPNSFTPEKEFNREFKVYGHEIKNFSIKIFNRWGELVYESVYFNKAWDGTHKGEKCPSGVYVYQIIASDPQGNNYKKSGFISLLR